MRRTCAVKDCLSDSSRTEDDGVTFHKIPHQTEIRTKWLSLCKIPKDQHSTKVLYVCSRHFLRDDFCISKNKIKFLLRQGVLPTVFQWDKPKLGEMGTETESTETTAEKEVPPSETAENEPLPDNIRTTKDTELTKDSTEANKEEVNETLEPSASTGKINFSIDQKIEVLDVNDVWCPATIIEEDYEGSEILIHFEKFSGSYNEWIPTDSSRLRLIAKDVEVRDEIKTKTTTQYAVGERCLASWNDGRKFPATVTKILPEDTYEVQYDDGFTKILKLHKMSKDKPQHASPLFDPIQTTKEERRERKRKFGSNVAQLFKRGRYEIEQAPSSKLATHLQAVQEANRSEQQDNVETWVPQWENGEPVGVESYIECGDSKRKSFIVPDPRLPPGWTKHIAQRVTGASAGKWDTFIVSPDNKRFRSKSEIKNYLDEYKSLKYNETQFDFSLHRVKAPKKKEGTEKESKKSQVIQHYPLDDEIGPTEDNIDPTSREDENPNHLKISLVNDSYQCPIEGCGKTYRKENLAQMHVKHYHPKYTKFLDSTPNVADLAYARTVGESLEKVSKPPKITKPQQLAHKIPPSGSNQKKDSEITKLLNSKTPVNVEVDSTLKDLLNKPESTLKNDDVSANILNTTRPSVGIKTILPVVRPTEEYELDTEDPLIPPFPIHIQRRQQQFEKQHEQQQQPQSDQLQQEGEEKPPHTALVDLAQGNVIIEGGEIIKIVRMKQEEIINCICEFPEEDGLMIQCDLCLCWQHAACNNYQRESQVPEKYVCYICQNPLQQRKSMKYRHDQDWMKQGSLASTKEDSVPVEVCERLRKSHDIIGGLSELCDYINNIAVGLRIAATPNHPKLHLWSKPWQAQEAVFQNVENVAPPANNDSMLLMYLKGGSRNDLNSHEVASETQRIPQPEKAINPENCKSNLLDHIALAQHRVTQRLDEFEKQLSELYTGYVKYEDNEMMSGLRATTKMLLDELNTLQEFSKVIN